MLKINKILTLAAICYLFSNQALIASDGRDDLGSEDNTSKKIVTPFWGKTENVVTGLVVVGAAVGLGYAGYRFCVKDCRPTCPGLLAKVKR